MGPEMAETFRPTSLGQLFGQEHLLNTLSNWADDPARISQSLLFYGPFGTGKTTVARILASYLITSPNDLIEVNASEARGIDDVRAWIESAKFMPFGANKVYLLDEIHQLTSVGQSAFLKILEEPPPNVYFFLCTTERHKLIPMITSRCVQLEFKLLNLDQTTDLLTYVSQGQLTKEQISQIYQRSGGHARDAVRLVEFPEAGGASISETSSGFNTAHFETLLDRLVSGTIDEKGYNYLTTAVTENHIEQMLDQFIDSRVLRTRLFKHYGELLKIRALKKQYLVSAREKYVHFLSLLLGG